MARLVDNPIVKGFRRRNDRMSRRVNRSGGHKSVKAPPEDLLLRPVPHLAFIEPARYDRLIARLELKNADYARGGKARAADGRAGVSRKRTAWPGQHVTCGVCGRLFYWGGHGQADHLMCSGARDYACWNGATFDGADAARRLAGAILGLAEGLPEFDAEFLARAEANALALRSARGGGRRPRGPGARRDRKEDRQPRRLAGPHRLQPGASGEARRGRGSQGPIARRSGRPRSRPARGPGPAADRRAEGEGPRGRRPPRLRRPGVRPADARPGARIAVFPHRALDGGRVVLRARLDVNFAPLLGAGGETVGDLIAATATVDLFDPPQQVAFRERVVALRGGGMTERAAAEELGLTVTAAQRAMKLDRLMRQLGADDPYCLLSEPPDDDGKVRRHRHPRYRFEPLADHRTTL